MLNFENRGHKSLRILVYEEIKKQILTGDIEPGARIMEVETAEALGVSRTPVRDAIKKLEREGLVVIEPRRGTYASRITDAELIEILDVREHLEGLAVLYATNRMKNTHKEKLKNISGKYINAVEEKKINKMVKYDTEFHKTIIEASENKTLASLIEQLDERMMRFRYAYFDNTRRAEMIPPEHEKIFNAIMAGDAHTAEDAARDHIRRLKEAVIDEKIGSRQ